MLLRFPLVVLLGTLFLSPVAAQDADVMRAGPLDNGKMWLFENPPVEYLAETYGLRPDADWFERARLAALRLPGCSASFVSADGLIVTNHHCVRGAIVDVTREGENLVEDGFAARSVDEERNVPGLYVDQLVAIEDVTERVLAATAAAQTDAERAEARRATVEALQAELAAARGGEEAGFRVQVVSLYNGGRFSAYTFRRHGDLRLVAAPEEPLGFFGGDPDNFTFPRYALDFAFLRAYGEDGRPLDTSDHYFEWSTDGVQPGDLVFVIGNPGSTNRGDTVAQLEFRRDVEVPATLGWIQNRIAALEAYLADHPDDQATQNRLFGLTNSEKAYIGRRDALADEIIMSRRRDFERQFRQRVEADPALRTEFGGLFDRMAEIQREKRSLAAEYGAVARLTNPAYSSATMRRAVRAVEVLTTPEGGRRAEAEATLREIADQPDAIDRGYLAGQLREIERYLESGFAGPLLAGRTPEAAAAAILAGSALSTAEGAAAALDAGTLSAEDPAVALAAAVLPRLADFQSAWAGLAEQEREVAGRLGQARFAVYGTAIPPDATFSPRFTDGVVRGYDYNGTVAPPYTTFFGMYDRNAAFGQDSEWRLPAAWLPAPPNLDRSTPLNFVSTSDTIGGNSGSPAVDRDLRLVGINFDRTIEGLSRDYIYFADRGRNVMVDARAVIESLESVYGLGRIVQELQTGALVGADRP